VELLATIVLVTVALGAARRGRARLAPLATGLTYAAVLLVSLPIVNGAVNPARSAAPVILSGDGWGQLWLFWAAPLLGAAIVGVMYRAFGGQTWSRWSGDAPGGGEDLAEAATAPPAPPEDGPADDVLIAEADSTRPAVIDGEEPPASR